jgi:hypothetical protein
MDIIQRVEAKKVGQGTDSVKTKEFEKDCDPTTL